MGSKPTYTVTAIERHGGRDVLIVEHTKTGERSSVYFRGSKLLYWRNGRPVRDRALKQVAKNALEGVGAS